jgi:hypothetical protein
MAALGNSEDGVTDDPSVRRQENDGQLKNVTIVNRSFNFDSEDNPTSVTVKFEIDEGAPARDLHVASFVLPGPFNESEIGQQELYDVSSGTFEGGETGQLTVSIPQPSTTSSASTGGVSEGGLFAFGAVGIGFVLSRRRRII